MVYDHDELQSNVQLKLLIYHKKTTVAKLFSKLIYNAKVLSRPDLLSTINSQRER